MLNVNTQAVLLSSAGQSSVDAAQKAFFVFGFFAA
jgi:hypothetical protein